MDLPSLEKLVLSNKHIVTKWNDELSKHDVTPVLNHRLNALISSVDKKIVTVENAIASLPTDELDSDIKRSADEFLDNCETIAALARSHSKSQNTITTPPVSTSTIFAKLPKIEIEPFYGSIEKFEQFWSLFSACIDQNVSLSDCSKLTYLISYLRGDAARVVSGMIVVPGNYTLAKDLLCKRYGQKRKIVDAIFQKILSMSSSDSHIENLRDFYDTLLINVRTLENNTIKVDDHSCLLTTHILRKLPEHVRTKIVSSFGVNDWLISTLMSTLEKHIVCGEACDAQSDACSSKNLDSTFMSLPLHSKSRSSRFCVFCDSNSHVSASCNKCKTFVQRFSIVKNKSLCLICLKKSHHKKDCKSGLKCENCSGEHNILLCKKKLAESNNNAIGNKLDKTTVTSTENSQNFTTTTCHSTLATTNYLGHQSEIALQQATAVASDSENHVSTHVNILFDTGSHLTFIRESVADKLNLKPVGKHSLSLSSFMNDNSELSEYSSVGLTLHGEDSNKTLSAIVVPYICPSRSPNAVLPLEFQKLNLAFSPVSGQTVSNVDILIGMDQYWSFMTNESKHSGDGYCAMKSLFGWTISGCSSVNTMVISGKPEVEKSLENNIEQVFNSDFSFLGGDDDNNDAAYLLRDLTFNKETNRYVCKLPWKQNMFLNDHFNLCEKRLYALHKKLKNDSALFSSYDVLIKQQLTDHIIEPCSDCDPDSPSAVHYMPHHGVLREQNSTTKLRVVYDGSAKLGKSDHSINDCLFVGPKLIPLLMPLVLKFRTNRFGLLGDIEKAFLMIEIAEEDRDSLRFLWFQNPQDLSEGLVSYRFCRLPFGLVCSPAILNAILRHHLEIHQSTLSDSLYVDDMVSGCDTAEEGVSKMKSVSATMALANFRMHKVVSNCPSVMENLNTPFVESSCVLGVPWNTRMDVLSVDLSKVLGAEESFTKRSVLATIGKIFDPLGIFSPLTVGMRMVLQNAWSECIPWDEALPDNMNDSMAVYLELMNELKEYNLPRYLCETENCSVTLYGFCDASEKAISCVFYLVSVNGENVVTSNFCCGKARVTPLKTKFTIPRLELLACLLMTNFYISFRDSLPVHDLKFFSDSLCCLYWIKNLCKCWKRYVQSRVEIIRSHVTENNWHFVPGEINPADVATRGICSVDSFMFWITGPSFLHSGELPSQPENLEPDTTVEELKPCTVLSTCAFVDPLPSVEFERFGTYRKLLYTIARVVCFIKRGNSSTYLNFVKKAEVFIVQSIQIRFFSDLIPDILGSRQKNITWQLQLYMANDLILVKTRIPGGTADLSESLLLLPKNSPITLLIIRHYHRLVMHGGVALTLSKIRERFWIVCGRQAVKKAIGQCVFCKRVRGLSYNYPVPPSLPDFRVSGKAFDTTGLDFAGPFHTDQGKCYMLLLTCAVSRAVHIELTTSLNRVEFLLAMQRFVSRRGAPTLLVSDNAKTFVSASMHLETLRSDTACVDYLVQNRIQWVFNCPRAPWWGDGSNVW